MKKKESERLIRMGKCEIIVKLRETLLFEHFFTFQSTKSFKVEQIKQKLKLKIFDKKGLKRAEPIELLGMLLQFI